MEAPLGSRGDKLVIAYQNSGSCIIFHGMNSTALSLSKCAVPFCSMTVDDEKNLLNSSQERF